MKRYQSDYKRIMSLIYEDYPVSPKADREIVFVPERIKAARSMGKGAAACRQSREVIFLHQAKMLADYEDDYEYEREVPVYRPTYESFNDEQLRGYFGWRSRVRKGDVLLAQQAFAFLYLYELLNLIGVESPEEGFFRISDFADRYRKFDPAIVPYAEQWLIDFVLYYELDPDLLSDRKPVLFDRALEVLLKAAENTGGRKADWTNPEIKTPQKTEGLQYSAREVFDALLFLSGMSLKKLPSYQGREDLFQRAAAETFLRMRAYYNAHRKQSLMDHYIGKPVNQPAPLFAGAVFHDEKAKKKAASSARYRLRAEDFSDNEKDQTSFDVKLSQITTYHFENGKWAVRTYPRDYRNPHFAELLKTVDGIIREEEGDPEACLCGLHTQWIRKLVRGAVDECRREMAEEKARRIEINFRMLEGIRNDAEVTMEKLMTEEERGLHALRGPEHSHLRGKKAVLPKTAKETEKKNSWNIEAAGEKEQNHPKEKEAEKEKEAFFGLTGEERSVLQGLLQNEPVSNIDPGQGIISVIVDHINEKLFDEFGDIVIGNEAQPVLIEDYREGLEELLSGFCGEQKTKHNGKSESAGKE